jgi:hypothetical protein
MKTKHCDWCDESFQTSISYQIYCSAECREEATKKKIAERYIQERRTRRLGQDRRCKSCNVRLSAYNDQEVCSSCLVNPNDVMKELKRVKGLSKNDKRFD